MSEQEDVRIWLRGNGYDEIANVIDEIIAEWKASGKRTRRNWWDILAGDKHGNPRKVAGRTFPVLKTAQIRQGKTVTKTASRRRGREKPQVRRIQARWANRSDPKESQDGEE